VLVNSSLTALHLKGNIIHSVKALAAMLEFNSTLLTMVIGGKRIVVDVEGAELIARALKSNRTLTRLELGDDDGVLTSAVVSALASNHALQSFTLWKSENEDMSAQSNHAFVEMLKVNQTLTALQLPSFRLSDPIAVRPLIEAIKCNHHLKSLNLSSNDLRPGTLIDIASILRENHSITSLDLGCNPEAITSQSVSVFLQALASNCTLRTLSLTDCRLQDVGCIAILSEALMQNRTLSSLNLAGNRLTAADIKLLSPILLHQNPTLTSLNLSRNYFESSGFAPLAEALATNTSLTELTLGYSIDAIAGSAIAAALRTNQSLKSLDLQCSNLGPSGLQQLADALVVNKTLTWLGLMTSRVDSAGVKVLAHALQQRQGVGIEINLRANPSSRGALNGIVLPPACRMIFQKSDI
jgi:Ran GTPase-activating protein (RanGAP) involved in mRNA processing and transport